MERLRAEAPKIETQIHGFKSDLGKKTASLHAVWEKFLQRVEDREELLHIAASFYENMSQVGHICSINPLCLIPDHFNPLCLIPNRFNPLYSLTTLTPLC